MEIKFKVPKWAMDKHIYIFAGAELLGIKEVRIGHKDGKHIISHLPLKIKPKDGRCTGCGSCCEVSGIPKVMINEIKKKLEGDYGEKCPLLGEHGCIMKGWIPFSCVKSVCTNYAGCTEKVVEVGRK